jgi:hypothetical protein
VLESAWKPDGVTALKILLGLFGSALSLMLTIFLPGLFLYNVAPACGVLFLASMVVLALTGNEPATRVAIALAAVTLSIGAGPFLYLAL